MKVQVRLTLSQPRWIMECTAPFDLTVVSVRLQLVLRIFFSSIQKMNKIEKLTGSLFSRAISCQRGTGTYTEALLGSYASSPCNMLSKSKNIPVHVQHCTESCASVHLPCCTNRMRTRPDQVVCACDSYNMVNERPAAA